MAWDEVLPVAQKEYVQWYVVEHDMPADAEAIISKANQYLNENLAQGH